MKMNKNSELFFSPELGPRKSNLGFQKRSDPRSTANNKKCENDKVKVVYLYPFVVFNGLLINH